MPEEFTIKTLEPELLTDMYLTFLDSFSDYQIPFKLNKKQFVDKFVKKLQIDFDYSVGVWDEKQGMVAFIFTSISTYQTKITAYNGGTGVRPSARGHGLVRKMYDFLIPLLKKKGVQQCVLEVLVQNEQALRAYESVGFTKSNHFKCYKLEKPDLRFAKLSNVSFAVRSTPQTALYTTFIDDSASFLDTLIFNDDLDRVKVIEAYDKNKCIGYLIYQPGFSRINHLAVSPIYRRSGVATGLVNELILQEEVEHITVLNVAEDSQTLNAFFKKMGFENQLNQFEMKLPLV